MPFAPTTATSGLVRNGELVFVSCPQWSDFDARGLSPTGPPRPEILARLRLDGDIQ